MKIVVVSLGCKVNQFESDVLSERLRAMGHEVSHNLEKADIYIINTCAVTNEAERKSRQMIAKVLAYSKDAKVMVMGCASEHNPMQFLGIKNVQFVSGTKFKSRLADFINEKGVQVLEQTNEYIEEKLSTSSHVRAHIKIQDGCNNFCSYCLIPYLRGRSVSRDFNCVVEEAKRLAQNGAKEFILTGINITDYKQNGKKSLGELVCELCKIGPRVRLGSIEESLISEDFLKQVSAYSNFCPHFHLSLQSGTAHVLKDMNRHYTPEEFLTSVTLIRKYFKNANITTDVIVGFPTETELDFKETCQFIKKVGFSYLHIFPYSKRDGTNASKLVDLANSIKKQRAKELEIINKELQNAYAESCTGQVFELLIEEKKGDYFVGHTQNYLLCYLKSETGKVNDICRVKILCRHEDGVMCELCCGENICE